MPSSSRVCLRPLSVAAQGSAYLLTQRSWTSLIGTGFRKWSFSRPRRLVVTRPASSSSLRCFMTPKRVIGSRCSSALRVCPSCLNSSSSRLRRVGSARALNTSSMPRGYVTDWSRVKPSDQVPASSAAADQLGRSRYDLLVRNVAQPLRHVPAMAERVGQLALALAPELAPELVPRVGARRRRPLPERVRIVSLDLEHRRRA